MLFRSGDDAVIHGLNETEVQYVITSHDLLPKFKNILRRTPRIHTIIYLEDPLHKADTKSVSDTVKIMSFCDVLAMGGRSGQGNWIQI